MKEKLRQLLAFEWLMMVILLLFWGSAVFLPLFFSHSLVDKKLFWQNFFFISGPYLLYGIIRIVYFLFRSFRWAYLISNFFFRSEKERLLADEWLLFLFFGLGWCCVIAYPLYYSEIWLWSWQAAVFWVIAPYTIGRFVIFLTYSVGWSFSTLTSKNKSKLSMKKYYLGIR